MLDKLRFTISLEKWHIKSHTFSQISKVGGTEQNLNLFNASRLSDILKHFFYKSHKQL